MTSKAAIYLLVANLALAAALLVFCVPVCSVFGHAQAKLFSTLVEVGDSHVDLVQGILKIVRTDIMVSTRVALCVSAGLLINATVCLLGLRQARGPAHRS